MTMAGVDEGTRRELEHFERQPDARHVRDEEPSYPRDGEPRRAKEEAIRGKGARRKGKGWKKKARLRAETTDAMHGAARIAFGRHELKGAQRDGRHPLAHALPEEAGRHDVRGRIPEVTYAPSLAT